MTIDNERLLEALERATGEKPDTINEGGRKCLAMAYDLLNGAGSAARAIAGHDGKLPPIAQWAVLAAGILEGVKPLKGRSTPVPKTITSEPTPLQRIEQATKQLAESTTAPAKPTATPPYLDPKRAQIDTLRAQLCALGNSREDAKAKYKLSTQIRELQNS